MDNSVIHVGGKQEQAPTEDMRDEFAKLTAQVIKMKQGEIILTGDFNTKIVIPEDEKYTKRKQKWENNIGIHPKHWIHSGINKTTTWTMDKRQQTQPKGKVSNWLHTDHTHNLLPCEQTRYRRRRNPETEMEKRIRPQHNNIWSHRKNPEKIRKKMEMAKKQTKKHEPTSTEQ